MERQLTEDIVQWIRSRYFGKYRGAVVDNSDPTQRGRVKVRVPAVLGDLTVWAMPCAPYAGEGVGAYGIPPVETGVWVEFEGGDPSFPIWTGAFWADDELPENEMGAGATPPIKIIRSETGLMVALDDGSKTITLSDSNGNNLLTIEVNDGKVTVKAATKAVIEAPRIELVQNSTHPLVFGDLLLQYLRSLEMVFNTHLHPGQLAAGVVPVTPTPPVPQIVNVATPQLHSTRVTTD